MNTERTCETCENKDICRYVKEICDKIKRIEALSDDGMLIVDMRCKRWREDKLERIKNVNEDGPKSEATALGSSNPSCCSVPGTLENNMIEKVRELHFCGPFLCGEVDKPRTPSRENHCF